MAPTTQRNIRMDDGLWEKLRRAAEARDITITALLIELAERHLAPGVEEEAAQVADAAFGWPMPNHQATARSPASAVVGQPSARRKVDRSAAPADLPSIAARKS